MNKKLFIKNNNGITLIALTITIIVLLILAGVSIGFVFSDNGIIEITKNTTEKNNGEIEKELENIQELKDELYNYQNS